MRKRKVLSTLSHDETDARERGRCDETRVTERGIEEEKERERKKKRKKNGEEDEEEGFSQYVEGIPHTREILARDRTSAAQEKWRRRKRGESGERM